MKAIRLGRAFLWLTLLLLSFIDIEPAQAQITTNTALPVAKGEGILRLQSRILRSTGDPTSMDRNLTVVAFPVVGVFGKLRVKSRGIVGGVIACAVNAGLLEDVLRIPHEIMPGTAF